MLQERREADAAHAKWEKEYGEVKQAEMILEKEAAEASDADRKLEDAKVRAAKKQKEALSHIKAVRYLDKDAQEAAAAATIIQARFRGYQQRSTLVREQQEARIAEAQASKELQNVENIKGRLTNLERQLTKILTQYPKGHEKVLKGQQKLAQVSHLSPRISLVLSTAQMVTL